MLNIESLHAGYGSSQVLTGASFKVPAGKLVALIGPNGAGKTTTMRAISGMIKPSQGVVRFDGREVHGLEAAAIARMGLAHVPEGRHVFAPLTVEDNLLLGAFRGLPKIFGFRARAQEGLDQIFELFPRLKERRRQVSGTLSGGEQQMLAIGRALMGKPVVMLLDEPSMGLAPVIVDEVFETIERLKAGGITMLLVEQMAQRALEVADFVYVMERGKVVVQGLPDDLKKDPRVVSAYLG